MLLEPPHLAGKVVNSVSIFGRPGFRLESAKERMDFADYSDPHLYYEIAISAPDAVAVILTCDKTVYRCIHAGRALMTAAPVVRRL